MEHILHDAFEPANFGTDDARIRHAGRVGGNAFAEHVKPGLDGRERVANFVGDAGGQCAERGELLLLFKQDFAQHEFRAEWRDEVAVEDDAEHGDEREQQNHADEKEDAQVRERVVHVGQE